MLKNRVYYYVCQDNNAQSGDEIRNPDRKPPWLIADHHIETVIFSEWPVTLWQVEVLDPILNKSLPENDRIRADANYTRAAAIRFLERLPVGLLFGKHGDLFCQVVSKAFSLTSQEASFLAGNRKKVNSRYYSNAWNRWLAQQQEAPENWQDQSGVLQIPLGYNAPSSPVNRGFSLISHGVWQAAKTACGTAAFIEEEEDGEVEVYLAKPWACAQDALLDAGMALGAPELIQDKERKALIAPWQSLQSFDTPSYG